MAIEEPKYDVVQVDGPFEIRKYAPILIAETFVDGDMDEASSKGFRLIADFIFGNNQVTDSNTSSKIAMTAPVTAEPVSKKIAMTAPVTAEPQSSESTMQAAKKWRIHFVMPSQFTLANIQKNFFMHGELAMRPLVLREIADELGLHESTISRVTTAKYMSTPYGTFELKYFFGSALGTESGGNASSTAVRALIKQFVASGNLNKPLSDNQISDMLKEKGIE